MSEQTLLPCPFCGGEAKPTAHLTYSWFAPVCKSCGARGPSVRIERGSDPQKMRELMNKADALWNRRSAPVAQPVARLFLDCEWNDWKGPLISMALVGEDGREWYEVIGCGDPSPWVAENVMPKLVQAWISPDELRTSLGRFLSHYKSVQIVADWPEDIAHFCNALVMPGGVRIATPDLHFHCWRGLEGESEWPHNALADARGLMLAAKGKS